MAKFIRVNYYQHKERGCWGYVKINIYKSWKTYFLFKIFFNSTYNWSFSSTGSSSSLK